jgi:rhodanese-related sulfurtransferase
LIDAGLDQGSVRVVKGGLQGWINAGLPTVKAD